MGWDAEDAEDLYWGSEHVQKSARQDECLTGDALEIAARRHVASAIAALKIKEGTDSMRDMSKDELEEMIEAAQAELSRRERMPVEPTDHTMVTFDFQFAGQGRAYSYAAIKTDGVWYVSGTTVDRLQGVTWETLINDFMDRGQIINLFTVIKHYGLRLP